MLWGKLDSQIIKMMDLINVFGLLLLSDVHKDQLRSERCVSVQVPLKKDQWSTDSVWKVKIRGIIFPPTISLPGLVTQKYLFFFILSKISLPDVNKKICLRSLVYQVHRCCSSAFEGTSPFTEAFNWERGWEERRVEERGTPSLFSHLWLNRHSLCGISHLLTA